MLLAPQQSQSIAEVLSLRGVEGPVGLLHHSRLLQILGANWLKVAFEAHMEH